MRIFKTFRFICVTVLLVIGTEVSADFTVDGISYNYNNDSDSTCYVTFRYSGYTGDITIPKKVTYNNRTLTVTQIGTAAFKGCSGMTSITIPNSITTIGASAFHDCSGMTSITIPNSVTEIGDNAFNDCSGLKKLVIEDGAEVLSLGHCMYFYSGNKGLFYECTLLTSLYLGRNLSYYKSFLPDTNHPPFKNISTLKEVTIGNNVTEIDEDAFYGCYDLKSITIPNSVTKIGDDAFYGCSGLTSITIPNSVTEIGKDAFLGCYGLKKLIFEAGTEILKFNGDKSPFNSCPLTSLYWDRHVYHNNNKLSFSGISTLKEVIIGNNITEIDGDAFYGCSNLENLIIEDGAEVLSFGYKTEDKRPFYDCPLTSLYLGRNLSYKGSYEYGPSPFSNKHTLTKITIGNSVTEIGSELFIGCYGLTNVIIPNSVTSIGNNAFAGCYELTELYSLNPTPPTIGVYTFSSEQYKNINVFVPQGSLSAYQSADTWKNFKNLQELFDPTGVETIKADMEKVDGTYYDIQGRKLNAPKNGLNIINGKKVLIRK